MMKTVAPSKLCDRQKLYFGKIVFLVKHFPEHSVNFVWQTEKVEAVFEVHNSKRINMNRDCFPKFSGMLKLTALFFRGLSAFQIRVLFAGRLNFLGGRLYGLITS